MIAEVKALAEALDRHVERLDLIARRMTETADLVRGLVINDTLLSETVVIPASGVWCASVQAPFAAVAVLNPGAQALTVVNAPAAIGAPTQGRGVLVVPATAFARWNMAGRELSIYGPAAASVAVVLLTRPVDPTVASV